MPCLLFTVPKFCYFDVILIVLIIKLKLSAFQTQILPLECVGVEKDFVNFVVK